MEEGRGRPRSLGDVMPGILREFGPRRRDERAELEEAWDRAAGPAVSGRSRVVGMAKDVLTVAVESAPLRQEIEMFRKAALLERMRAEYTKRKIADLKCVLRAR